MNSALLAISHIRVEQANVVFDSYYILKSGKKADVAADKSLAL